MKILILEPHAHGHHGPYLQWIATGLVEHGVETTIITMPETLNHPCLQALLERFKVDESKLLHIIPGSPGALFARGSDRSTSILIREMDYWRLFKAWYEAHMETVRPDVVFLPYADYCLYAIGLLGSPFGKCPWGALVMRPSFHYRRMGINAPKPAFAWIKQLLFSRVLGNQHLKCLLAIDEPLAQYFEDKDANFEKLSFFPEPAELGKLPESGVAKQQLGIESGRNVILLYGGLTARKGIAELLRALATSEFPTAVTVLIAGKVIEPSIRKLFNEPWVRDLHDSGRLKVIDRFIEHEEEPTLFAAADIVWLGYRNHYNSSGLLLQAVNADRPVLACKDGILGWQTQRHGLGLTVNPNDVIEVAATVQALLDESSKVKSRNRYTDLWRPPTISEAQETLVQMLHNQ